MDTKEHWNKIYGTKKPTEVSWFQPTPETSLKFIRELNLPKGAAVIDIGGGDSFLAEALLKDGYTNITVLDISEKAISRVRERMGSAAEKIKWIVADAAQFTPEEKYDLWHDRAAFHFLTEEIQIKNYLKALKQYTTAGGYAVLGTFSEKGPTKCSGIEIRQYATEDLIKLLCPDFIALECANVKHETPSGSTQDFSFCSFKKRILDSDQVML